MMGRAEKDGWITWNWQRRAGDPKPDQPDAESLNDQDLQRCEYVRVLPAGREYAAREEQAKEAGPTAPATPILRGEQLEVLRELVKEARAVERSQRRFYLSITSGPDMVQGPAGPREVLAEDIYALQEAGAFQVRAEFVGGDMEFTISPDGEAMADAAACEDPLARIEEEITRVYMDSEAFKAVHPVAYQRWHESAELLWGPEAERELTTIGHKTREAVQQFAANLVDRHAPPDASSEPTHTVQRLRAVIDLHRAQLGEARHELLEALVKFWGEVNDLQQRQEHGGLKEGQPLSWEDGRPAVFHTAIVMFEIERTLPAPATS